MSKKAKGEPLLELINKMKKNKICLPTFQREFVWKPKEMASLIMSIMRGYPIGSLLLLKKSENNIQPRPIARIDIFDPRECKYIVMDGQQRLTTIWHVGHQAKRGVFNYRGTAYALFICLSKLEENDLHNIQKNFIKCIPVWDEDDSRLSEGKVENQVEHDIMPLYILLDKKKRATWLNSAKNKLSRKVISNLRLIASKYEKYEIPNEIIDYRIDDQALCNIFHLINDSGTELDLFDLAVVKYQSLNIDIDLRSMWTKSFENNKYFGLDKYDLDPIYILRIICIVRKSLIQYKSSKKELKSTIQKTDIDNTVKLYINKKNDFAKDWNNAVKWLNESFDYFSDHFGADNARKIPYAPMIIVLASILWWGEENQITPNEYLNIIKRWYWMSIFKNMYEKNTNDVVAEHYLLLRQWIREKSKTPKHFIKYHIKRKDLYYLTNSSNAIYRAILCLPYLRGAYDLYKPLKLKNKKVEDHHIFPKNWLQTKMKTPKQYLINCVLNRTYIFSESNRKIGAKRPKQYFMQMDDKIYEDNADKKMLDNLNSHFIDEKALECIRFDDYKGFINRRSALIANYVNNDLID